MARGKAISVKIATAKVIKSLETKLAEIKADYKNQDSLNEKFQKTMDKYHKDLAKLAISALSKAEEVNASTRWNGEVAVNFTLPKGAIKVPEAPTKDYTEMHQWQYKETCEEIENAIRILKMTDEEVVNTSTYNAIARYL